MKTMRIIVPVCLGVTSVLATSACGGGSEDLDNTESVETGVAELSLDMPVPFLRQRDYAGIGESACAATSLAMMLRYYYPNSFIDVPEIYHAGLQVYSYHGPGVGYRNLSWGKGWTTDPGNNAIPSGFKGYYSNLGSSYATNSAVQEYLDRIWGVQSTILHTESAVYSAINNGPLIGHVWGHGNQAANWGHYLIIRGIDTKGTLDHADDIIYVNDPYDKWGSWDTGGEKKAVSNKDFFVKGKYGAPWFRDAITVTPQDTFTQRQYTVVVDTGHNTLSGNASSHLFQVDDINDKIGASSDYTWWHSYGAASGVTGDWYYAKENGHRARWTPKLSKSGNYQVSVKFLGDAQSGNVTYRIYDAWGTELASAVVNQYKVTRQWAYSVLFSSVSLSNGAYVRATDITPSSNIDAIKFKYLGP